MRVKCAWCLNVLSDNPTPYQWLHQMCPECFTRLNPEEDDMLIACLSCKKLVDKGIIDKARKGESDPQVICEKCRKLQGEK